MRREAQQVAGLQRAALGLDDERALAGDDVEKLLLPVMVVVLHRVPGRESEEVGAQLACSQRLGEAVHSVLVSFVTLLGRDLGLDDCPRLAHGVLHRRSLRWFGAVPVLSPVASASNRRVAYTSRSLGARAPAAQPRRACLSADRGVRRHDTSEDMSRSARRRRDRRRTTNDTARAGRVVQQRWLARADLLPVTLIALAAGVSRLAWVAIVKAQPVSDFLFYYRGAVNIATGAGYSIRDHATAFFPVGYPALLAGVFKVAGTDTAVMKLTNVALWVVAAVLAYVLGKQVAGRTAGIVAGAIVACYPEYIVYSGLGASENLMVPLLLGTVVVLAGAAPRPHERPPRRPRRRVARCRDPRPLDGACPCPCCSSPICSSAAGRRHCDRPRPCSASVRWSSCRGWCATRSASALR